MVTVFFQDTGGSCQWMGCASSRGKTSCSNGKCKCTLATAANFLWAFGGFRGYLYVWFNRDNHESNYKYDHQ
jgi:hypothetical protein